VKKVTILGSTGSIGKTALRVIETYRDQLSAFCLACGNNQELLARQVCHFRPECAVISVDEPLGYLKDVCLQNKCELLAGRNGLIQAAELEEADVVLAAMIGAAGLEPTLAAAKAGKRIALANKEVMVMAGELVLTVAEKSGAEILPVDSEHNAIFQCLRGERRDDLSRILLCASGGPFLNTEKAAFDSITVEQALDHPRWNMGRKITVDSATLMNKGLEMIEARWLFDVAPEQIEVVIHPQSIVHSMVEYVDGSIIAQIGRTDMFIPIQFCFSYPERWRNADQRLELPDIGSLDFQYPDNDRFPALNLARVALDTGGTLPAALNAGDEVAVAAFLNKRISFPSIMRIVDETMQRHTTRKADSLESILQADADSRMDASNAVEKLGI
jgi:1-deoxy-D-xylulose-5-phosphate reductoisomerase